MKGEKYSKYLLRNVWCACAAIRCIVKYLAIQIYPAFVRLHVFCLNVFKYRILSCMSDPFNTKN